MTTDPETIRLLEQIRDQTGGGSTLEIQDDGTRIESATSILNFTDAIDATNPSSGSVNALVADDGITSAKIAADAVGSSEIATDAVGSDEIGTGAVDSDEIAVNAVGTSEIDLSITPTWTGLHTFDSGVTLNGSLTDQAANSITDFAGTNLSVSGGTLNAAGSSPPISVPDNTLALDFADDSGAETIVDMGVTSSPVAGTEQSLSIAIGGADIFKTYAEADGAGGIQNQRTEVLSGDLRVPTGNVLEDESGTSRLQLNSADTSLRYESGNAAITANSNSGLFIYGRGGPIDMSPVSADLRLATGQAIEDGGGTERLLFSGGYTALKDETGVDMLVADDGFGTSIKSKSDTPIIFRDLQGDFDAVKYITSGTAPGMLELTNATLEVSAAQIGYERGSVSIQIAEAASDLAGKIEFESLTDSTNDTLSPVVEARTESSVSEIRAIDGAGNATTLT